jgi:hypothetical protein
MNETNTNAQIPDWKCERYLLNELDDAEMEFIRRAAERDESLRARIEALEGSSREILEQYPPPWMSQRIGEKLAKTEASSRRTRRARPTHFPRAVLVPAGVLTAAVLVLFVLPVFQSADRADIEQTRVKGSLAHLRLHRAVEDGSQELEDGDHAEAGDLIRLQYEADADAYGAILSLDGRGTITTHLPANGNEAAPLEAGQSRFLDYAYELDDAPRWELFLFFSSPETFRLDDLIAALEALPSVAQPDELDRIEEDLLEELQLPDSFRVSTFILIKD